MSTFRSFTCALAVAFTVAGAFVPSPAAAEVPVAPQGPRWEKIGARVVDGRMDRDVISVGRAKGRYSAIRMRVDGGSLVLHELRVVFTNGEVFEPRTRLVFDKSSSTRIIDLPGDTRTIDRIELKYGNLSSRTRARVEVWGRDHSGSR